MSVPDKDVVSAHDLALDEPGSAGRRALRWSLVLSGVLVALAAALVVWGDIPLPAYSQFVPLHVTFVFLLDAVTAFLLFGQFHYRRRPVYLILGAAYLFTALVSIPFLLAFPAALQTKGGIIGGPQSAIWAWHEWHILFPAIVAAALVLHDRWEGAPLTAARLWPLTLGTCVGVVALVLAVTGSITAGHDALPVLIDVTRKPPLTQAFYWAGGAAAAITLVALGLAWREGRRGVVLHLWLSVALIAFLADITASLGAHARYTVGWYFGRVESLIAASVLVLVFLAEITSLYRRLGRTVRELSDANRRAEAATRAKSAFLANMSHEIRTPMNAIMGLAHLLEDSRLNEQERDYVGKIKISARSLLGILNDILDFSKVEAGRVELERIPFSLDEVLNKVAVVASINARDKGVETVFSVAPDVPAGLLGDPLRLEQILINLTGNAVKFTEEGEIVLAVTRETGDEQTLTLKFAVRDTGIGINEEKRSHLFAAFGQLDSSTSRKYGGTGLGLAISNRLVRLMGGSLDVDSTPGEGSEFHFTARFGKAPVDAFSRRTYEGLDDLSVLVVDDNDTAREVLARTCGTFRWRAEPAASAADALDILRHRSAEGRTFDVLLVDWRMPGMDGIELLERAKADPAIVLPSVILMVTAFGTHTDLRTGPGTGIDALLSKPATPSSLFDAVARARGGSATLEAAVGQTPLSGRLLGLRVLLAEDNEINREVAADILRRAGAEVEAVADGHATITALETRPQGFDAVLMDIQMPGMDGYEATGIIRSRLRLAELPIIAMTANALEEDRRRSLAAGMDAHVAKPIDIEDLIATLTAQVPGIGRGPSRPMPDTPRADPPELPPDLPGIDLRAALIRLGGDRGKFLTLLEHFTETLGDTASEVRGLLESDEREEAAKILHRLRGVASNLGASEVARNATASEAAIKDGKDDRIPGLLADLDAATAIVVATARSVIPEAAPLFDPSALSRVVGNDSGKQTRLRETFLAQARDTLSQAHVAWDRGEVREVAALCHKLKASARTVGAGALGDLCEGLETAGKAGDQTKIADLFTNLDETFIRTRELMGEGGTEP